LILYEDVILDYGGVESNNLQLHMDKIVDATALGLR